MLLTELINCRGLTLDKVEVNAAENGELVVIISVEVCFATCNGFFVSVCMYRN